MASPLVYTAHTPLTPATTLPALSSNDGTANTNKPPPTSRRPLPLGSDRDPAAHLEPVPRWRAYMPPAFRGVPTWVLAAALVGMALVCFCVTLLLIYMRKWFSSRAAHGHHETAGAAGAGATTAATGSQPTSSSETIASSNENGSAPPQAPGVLERNEADATGSDAAGSSSSNYHSQAVVSASGLLHTSRMADTCALLMRKAAEAATMSAQDSTPFMALLHAQQAVSYVSVARDLADDAYLQAFVPGMSVATFAKHVQQAQTDAATRLWAQNPTAAPSSVVSCYTGWLRST